MNADEFVSRLSDAKPESLRVSEAGFTGIGAEEFLRAFQADRRLPASSTAAVDLPSSLLANYDLSSVEIGMFRFRPSVIVSEAFLIFGEYEADPIAVDPNGHEIVMLDHSRPDRIVARCAKSVEEFLDALLICARYLGECVVDSRARCDAERMSMLARSTEAAGGAAYRQFFSLLLGVF